jgi:hypothetical protein
VLTTTTRGGGCLLPKIFNGNKAKIKRRKENQRKPAKMVG